MTNRDEARNDWRAFRAMPDDVLFFRDGKPASLNLDHYFRSLFPPLPSTVYGMIRTARLCDYGVELEGLNRARWNDLPADLRAEVGEWGEIGSIRLRGPWLVRARETGGAESEVLLPAPADLGLVFAGDASDADSDPRKVVRYLPVEVDRRRRSWSHGLELMQPYFVDDTGTWREWTPRADEADPKSADGWFVTCAGMDRWLAGKTPRVEDLVRSSGLWSVERRIGIGLEASTRTSKDSRLFSYGYVRLQPGVGVGFEVRGCDLQSSRIAWLGGEGRVVHIEHGPSLSDRFGDPVREHSRATLYLGTPAVFTGPEASSPSHPAVYAAAVRSTVPIGGWDVARGGPKRLRRGVTAGSTYYVEAGDSIRSYLPVSEMHEQGFGLALAGSVPEGGS